MPEGFMKIFGLQKMTLLDFPGHVACTVFTGGCDFRCPFCHNYALACGKETPVIGTEAFFQFLESRRGLLDGVAVSGGEPCLQQELPVLLAGIRERGFLIKLDTNGYHPLALKALIRDGLVDYVAMDIKNSPEKYAKTAGLDETVFDFERIRESLSFLMEGRVDYELRTTVVDQLHEAEDFEAIGRLIAGAPRYFLQAFVDREQVPYAGFSARFAEKMAAFAGLARAYLPDTQLRVFEQ